MVFMTEVQLKSHVMNFRPLGQVALDKEIKWAQRAEAWVKQRLSQYKLPGLHFNTPAACADLIL